MSVTDIVIGMVGSGGDGIVAVGDILTATAASEGIHCMQFKSFGPQIRGGESSCTIHLSDKPVLSLGGNLDVLLVFNWDDYLRFSGELNVKKGVVVIADEKNVPESLPLNDGIKPSEVFKLPFDELVKESGNPKSKNIIALGALAQIFGLPRDGLKKSIERKFSKKKEEILAANLKAIDIGINYAVSNNLKSVLQFSYKKETSHYITTGNEALAYGALFAGCRFFASYPITPASEIMEWMSRELPKFGGTMVQAEDEISAACMVVGASFGGVKAMTATSGPGLSLKIEALGLASMAELPLVAVNVQRGGPATGIPTKYEQADLQQAVYGMHGDAPHAVIAPSNVKDCFDAAVEAFNIAEQYQMPVIILSDQFIGHRKETVSDFSRDLEVVGRETPKNPAKGEYKRFVVTPSGVSPMSYPGIAGGEYTCSGIEHNEAGSPVSSHKAHEIMSAKRERKLEHLAKNYKFIQRYGSARPDVGIITWGSTCGAVREAVEAAASLKLNVGAIIPRLIYPVQADVINDFIKGCKKIIIVELSYSGQFRRYLSAFCRLPENVVHLKSSGARMFEASEILERIS